MPTYNDIHGRALKYTVANANANDITGSSARIFSVVVVANTATEDGNVNVFNNNVNTGTTYRNHFRATEELPMTIHSFGPQGLKGAGISVGNLSNCIVTILYQED